MADLSLDDKYTARTGEVVMSGIQALVRVPLDQHRRDRAAGLRTATLVSGYRGSPLGGLDVAFERAGALLDEHHVRFIAGINEDLAATAIYGSQLANTFPGARYDGVLGMWYGKGPGVDRTGDAFRHANVAGVGRHGGVLAVAGDDPSAKSSTIASASELALVDVQMPVLYPGTVQEVLELGLVGFALSRYCGSWVGLKVVTNVADAFSTVVIGDGHPIVQPALEIDGRPWAHTQNPRLIAPGSIAQERELHEGRAIAAREFVAANRINRLTIDPDDAWLGIVCAGKTYYDVVDALDTLGVDSTSAKALGVRVLKLGAIHPLEPSIVNRFARGLDEIVVVEEKRSFVELFLRDLLYGTTGAPRIVGKRDESGRALLPGHGELDADRIRPVLRARLSARIGAGRLRPEPASNAPRQLIALTAADTRTPYFCSGCPHNRSTVVPDGSLANGAVGCSTMAIWMDRRTDNIVQMGAEGAQWVGAAPFTATPHLIQNMGDGTFLHSGSLAVRQAVAAGTNITYKLLYNAAVAMTGGQQHDAALGLSDIVRSLLAEGVARVLVVSDDPDGRRPELPGGVDAWHRDRLVEAQELLRDVPGVTVLVYDQACAADLRRKRKRGLAATPPFRIVINEAVCEGCGDCGVKSNCLSVQPVDTVFGRKTRIHQASCNLDATCVTGRCPAFVKVTPRGERRRGGASRRALDTGSLPDPVLQVGPAVDVLMAGVGGTGVVTVNQVLGVAARLAGKYSSALDQTGLAQKGGSVVSHLRLSPTPIAGGNLVGRGRADVLLAFDIVTAAQDVNIARLDPDRTIAVVSASTAPTGPEVRDVNAVRPAITVLHARVEASTRPGTMVRLDAEAISEALFADTMPANLIVVGAAYQAGVLPIDAHSIEQAIELNGSGAATNVAAFRAGRALVVRPEAIAELLAAAGGNQPDRHPDHPDHPDRRAAADVLPGSLRRRIEASEIPDAARDLVTHCTADLIGYQSVAYATEYLDDVERVAHHEIDGRSELTCTVARALHHLMAYKDEYEVARLHLGTGFATAVEREFGAGASTRFLLQPPVLERIGIKHKIALGRSARVTFRALAAGKRLRGTRLDLFGHTTHRRMERALAGELREQTRTALDHLGTRSPDDRAGAYERVVAALSLADGIRGFDEVKERNIATWRTASQAAFESLLHPLTTVTPNQQTV